MINSLNFNKCLVSYNRSQDREQFYHPLNSFLSFCRQLHFPFLTLDLLSIPTVLLFYRMSCVVFEFGYFTQQTHLRFIHTLVCP